MRTLSGPVITAIAQKQVALAQLVRMDLDIPWYVNTSGWDLTWGGNTYLGVGGAGRIDEVEDSPAELRSLQFELPAVNADDIATALAADVQGRLVTLYTAVFDPTSYAVLDAIVEWQGRLDVMNIADSGDVSIIQVSAEHVGIDLLRPSGLKYSHQDQQRLYPGERSFEYVIDQSEQQIVFPAASYFRR